MWIRESNPSHPPSWEKDIPFLPCVIMCMCLIFIFVLGRFRNFRGRMVKGMQGNRFVLVLRGLWGKLIG